MKVIEDTLKELNIQKIEVICEDKGALDYTIKAGSSPQSKEWRNAYEKEYVVYSGNNPAMLQNADCFESDAVIIDLEDAVHVNEKTTPETSCITIWKA